MAMNFVIDEARNAVVVKGCDFDIVQKIRIDGNGRRFFHVPNLLNNPTFSMSSQLFVNRIKDAIDTIRNGDGDAIKTVPLFGGEYVVRYLDRTYGEKIRKQTLNGWKNAKFAYALRIGKLELNTSDNVALFPDIPVRYFETEEAATSYLNNLIETAKQDAERFNSLAKTDNMESFVNELKTFSEARERLWLWKTNKSENANEPCPIRVAQTVRR